MKKQKILLSLTSVLLAVLLLLGSYFASGYYFSRQSRIAFYNSDATEQTATAERFLDDSRLYFPADYADMVYLLQRAAGHGALYYEIAAEWLRAQGYEMHIRQDLAVANFYWVPRDLHLSDYREQIAPLLESIYVPVLPESAQTEFFYSAISFPKSDEETGNISYPEEKIWISVIEIDKETRERICNTVFYYTYDPYVWQNSYANEAEYHGITAVRTLQTADGHTVTYYTPQYLNETLEHGSSWGELYMIEDVPMYVSPSTYHYGINGRDALLSLQDSTMRSYADYLENDEALQAKMSEYWRTISLIHHAIVIYAALLLLCVIALIATARALRRADRNAKTRSGTKQRPLTSLLLCSLFFLCIATGLIIARVQTYQKDKQDRQLIYQQQAIYQATISETRMERTHMSYVPLQTLSLIHRAAQKDALFFFLAMQRATELTPADSDTNFHNALTRWISEDLDRATYQKEIAPAFEDIFVPVTDEHASYEYNTYQVTVRKSVQDPSALPANQADRIRVRYALTDRETGVTGKYWDYAVLPWSVDAWTDQYMMGEEEAQLSLQTKNGYTATYFAPKSTSILLSNSNWAELHTGKEVLTYLTIQTEGALQNSTVLPLAELLEDENILSEDMAKQWNALRAQYVTYVAFLAWSLLNVLIFAITAVLLIKNMRKKV